MAFVTTPLMGVGYFKYNDQGWSEQYWMESTSPEIATQHFKNIMLWRSGFLAKGGVITWAAILRADDLRQSWAVLDRPRENESAQELLYDPVMGEYPGMISPPQGGVPGQGHALTIPRRPNTAQTGILLRSEAKGGKGVLRVLHGVPDTWVYNATLQRVLDPMRFDGQPQQYEANRTMEETFERFCHWLRVFTSHMRVTKAPAGVVTADGKLYDKNPFTRMMVRGVANRKVGRPFGRSRGRATAQS